MSSKVVKYALEYLVIKNIRTDKVSKIEKITDEICKLSEIMSVQDAIYVTMEDEYRMSMKHNYERFE